MPAVNWSPGLANYAAEWLNQTGPAMCGGLSNPMGDPAMLYSKRAGLPYGEDLYTFVFDPTAPAGNTAVDAVTAWRWQRSAYRSRTGQCAADGVCNDFLQIVWRPTAFVGCSSYTCPSALTPNSKTSLYAFLCYFDPPGSLPQPPPPRPPPNPPPRLFPPPPLPPPPSPPPPPPPSPPPPRPPPPPLPPPPSPPPSPSPPPPPPTPPSPFSASTTQVPATAAASLAQILNAAR